MQAAATHGKPKSSPMPIFFTFALTSSQADGNYILEGMCQDSGWGRPRQWVDRMCFAFGCLKWYQLIKDKHPNRRTVAEGNQKRIKMYNQCRIEYQGTKTTIEPAHFLLPSTDCIWEKALVTALVNCFPGTKQDKTHTEGFVFIMVLGVLYSPAVLLSSPHRTEMGSTEEWSDRFLLSPNISAPSLSPAPTLSRIRNG